MAHGKGKKFLVGLLALLIVAGGAAGVYIYMFGKKHKTEYGEKHKITEKEASLVERFETQVKKCAKVLFTHEKLPYKPPKGAEADGYKKASGVVIQEIRVCLQGQKTADGKGFSPPNMQGSQLEPLAAAKSCKEFADKFVSLVACETRLEALIDDAGFIDPEDDDAEPKKDDKAAPKKDDKAAPKKDDMAAKPAGDMAAKPAGDMAAKPAGDMAAKPAGDMAAKPAGDMAAKPKTDAMK
jgi:hypothetical protein